MMRNRNAPDPKATMSLKERMKYFEAAAAAEAAKKKPPPKLSTPMRRSISSTGSSTGPSPTTSSPRALAPRSAASAPGGVCTRVSLSRTISGESVVKEVLSPISLPTRIRISEDDDNIFPTTKKDETMQDLNKCKFSEVRRDSVEVLDHSSTHYLAKGVIEPVENRVEEEKSGVQRDTDRDSGVSCSSDDQDPDTLSDTEVTELRSVDSRDSGVFASKSGELDKVQRVYIATSSVESTDDTMTESEVTSESEASETSAVEQERAPTPVKSPWSSLLDDDMEHCEEEEEGSDSSNKDSEETKAESEEDAHTLVDTSLNEDEKVIANYHIYRNAGRIGNW